MWPFMHWGLRLDCVVTRALTLCGVALGWLAHPQTTIIRRLLDIARGMVYVHSQKVVHGDLKCSNVMLVSNTQDPDMFVAKVR